MGETEADSEAERRARARARAAWPMRRFALGEEPRDELLATTTAEERIAMVEELSVQAWLLTGRPFPSYTRAEMPGRVIRRGGG